MKRIIFLVLAIAVVFCFAACATETENGIANPFVGTWDGEAFFSEVWTFNADGTGSNENDLLSYNFNYDFTETELNIYQEFFGTYSDTPVVYEYTADGDTIVLYDSEFDAEYVLTKK